MLVCTLYMLILNCSLIVKTFLQYSVQGSSDVIYLYEVEMVAWRHKGDFEAERHTHTQAESIGGREGKREREREADGARLLGVLAVEIIQSIISERQRALRHYCCNEVLRLCRCAGHANRKCFLCSRRPTLHARATAIHEQWLFLPNKFDCVRR